MIEQALKEKGLTLPAAPAPAGSYLPAMRSGNLLFVAGQLPLREGQMVASGAVGRDVTLEQAQAAAVQCLLNALAIVGGELGGDFSRIARIVRLGVFVQCVNGFTEQPEVANAASELAAELLGEAGRHVRAAVGVNALPRNAAVELEMTVEVTQ